MKRGVRFELRKNKPSLPAKKTGVGFKLKEPSNQSQEEKDPWPYWLKGMGSSRGDTRNKQQKKNTRRSQLQTQAEQKSPEKAEREPKKERIQRPIREHQKRGGGASKHGHSMNKKA